MTKKAFARINFDEYEQEIEQLISTHLSSVDPLPRKPNGYHITLQYCGEREQSIELAKKSLNEIKLEPRLVQVNKVLAFPSVNDAEVYAFGLYNSLPVDYIRAKFLEKMGFADSLYTPHMTLRKAKEVYTQFGDGVEVYKEFDPVPFMITNVSILVSDSKVNEWYTKHF